MTNLLWFLAGLVIALFVIGGLAGWYGSRMVGRLPRRSVLPEHHHETEDATEPPTKS